MTTLTNNAHFQCIINNLFSVVFFFFLCHFSGWSAVNIHRRHYLYEPPDISIEDDIISGWLLIYILLWRDLMGRNNRINAKPWGPPGVSRHVKRHGSTCPPLKGQSQSTDSSIYCREYGSSNPKCINYDCTFPTRHRRHAKYYIDVRWINVVGFFYFFKNANNVASPIMTFNRF